MRQYTPIERQILTEVEARLDRIEHETRQELDMDEKAIMDLMSRVDTLESEVYELKTEDE